MLLIFIVISLALPSGSYYIYPLHISVCNYPDGCRHERGHRLDQSLGFVSQTPEFQAAISRYIEGCENIDTTVDQDTLLGVVIVCGIVDEFPGVSAPHKPYDNPITALLFSMHDNNGWGGYDELYAEIFEFSEYVIIPAELAGFFGEDETKYYLELGVKP